MIDIRNKKNFNNNNIPVGLLSQSLNTNMSVESYFSSKFNPLITVFFLPSLSLPAWSLHTNNKLTLTQLSSTTLFSLHQFFYSYFADLRTRVTKIQSRYIALSQLEHRSAFCRGYIVFPSTRFYKNTVRISTTFYSIKGLKQII